MPDYSLFDSMFPLQDRLRTVAAQRDEFKRRSLQARQALEDLRKAYEAGDLEKIEHLLTMYTAITHGEIERPKEFR